MISEQVFKKAKCGDCGCHEGQLHEYGCDQERCPHCGGQLISCECSLKLNGYKVDPKKKYWGLPKNVYENGLPHDQQENYEMQIVKKGRIPHIFYPICCRRCLVVAPKFFHADDWTKVIPKELQDKILCKRCYNKIKEWMNK